jgi:hypothetical protein
VDAVGYWYAGVSSLAEVPVEQLVDALVADVDEGRVFDPRVVWELAVRAARADGVELIVPRSPGDGTTASHWPTACWPSVDCS